MYQHFKAIAESTKLPVMLYNVPGRTVVSMSAETTLRLAQLPNIVATKECASLDQVDADRDWRTRRVPSSIAVMIA